jgi:hypothetical protein
VVGDVGGQVIVGIVRSGNEVAVFIWNSGLGSTLGVPPAGAWPEFWSCARAGVSLENAVTQPSRAPTARAIAVLLVA